MAEIGEAIIRVRPNAQGFMSEIEKAISSGSQGFGNALTGALGKAAKIGTAALAGATTAIGAFGAASVKAGMSFDSSMSQVAATMGKTMSEMESEVGSVDLAWGTFSGNLREYAQEMGKNTAFSATEAADALNYMALAGYDTQTSMEMLPNVLNLAAAGGMDLARASDMVTDTQTAFGISLDRTSQMVDEMAKAASTGNTSVEQLGDAFLTVGGLAQELNGGMVTLADGTKKPVDGVQELEIALTAMANAGVKGSEAGTHMRNMLLKLSSPTKEGVAQLEALGVAVFDDAGQMRSLSDIFGDLSGSLGKLTQEEKIQAISELFNTRDLASAEALLNAVGQDWDAIGASILDADGAAQKMADTQLDNLAGDVTLFKSALEGTQIAISDGLSPSLREFVQFGTKGLSELTTAFQEGGVTGAMEQLGKILADGINMIVADTPKMVNAGIQLIAALGQGIAQNAPAIFSAIIEIGGQLGDAVMGLMDTAASYIADFDWAGVASDIAAFLKNAFGGEAASHFVDTAVSIVSGLVSGISQSLPALLPAAIDIILNLASSILDNVDQLFDAADAMISGLVNGIVAALPVLIAEAPIIILKFTEALVTHLPQVILLGPKIIAQLAVGIIQALPQLGEAALQAITQIGTSLSENAFSVIEKGREIAGNIVSGIAERFIEIKEAGAQLIENIKAGINEKISGVAEAFNNVWNSLLQNPVIATFAQYVIDTFNNMKDTVVGIWNGIKESASGIWQMTKTVILGPVLLLTDLVTGDFEKLGSDAKNIWTNIKKAADSIWNGMKKALSSIATGIRTQVVSALTALKNSAAQIWKAVKQTAVETWNNIKSTVITTVTNLVNSIRTWITQVPAIIKEKFGEAVEYIKDLPGKATEWGRDLIGNFVDGLKQKWADLKSSLSETAETIRSYLHFSEPDEGPLKDFHTYAPDMMKLFAQGITDNIGIVTNAIDQMASDMLSVDASKDLRALTGNGGSQEKAHSSRNVVINNSFYINGTNRDGKELAKETAYYLDAEVQRLAGVWA